MESLIVNFHLGGKCTINPSGEIIVSFYLSLIKRQIKIPPWKWGEISID